MIRPSELQRITYSLFATSRHNLILWLLQLLLKFNLNMTPYFWIYLQNSTIFFTQGEKYFKKLGVWKNQKVMADTSIIFNSSSDVMMTSLTIQKRIIGHIGSAILNWSNAFHFTWHTYINRGNSDRKIDLLLKDAYRKPQNPQFMKFPEKWTLLKIEPSLCHVVILNSCLFSQIGH